MKERPQAGAAGRRGAGPLVLSALAVALLALAISAYALSQLSGLRDEVTALRAAVQALTRQRLEGPAGMRPPPAQLDEHE